MKTPVKKTLLAIFSVSITAGTLYYGYTKIKEFAIKKLVETWTRIKLTTANALNEDAQGKLRLELDKLFLWEIKLLASLTSRIQDKAPDGEKAIIIKKIKDKKIVERADLSSIIEFLEYKKYIA